MKNEFEIINYNFGSAPDLFISFDVLQTTPDLVGAGMISLCGHQLGRTGEEVLLHPVLLLCEEFISLARTSNGEEKQLSSTEFLDGCTAWVRRRDDLLDVRWIGPDNLETRATISFEKAVKTVTEFRKLIDPAR